MMDKSPYFSIIVPVYNGVDTLHRCLESIFDSSGCDCEVIVVNDGSTDNTIDIVRQFPCEVINLSKNRGAARARNEGAKEAEGDVLLFVDADVILERDTIGKLAETFQKKSVQILTGIYGKKIIYPNAVSVYKNLLLHFEHMHPSQRFWTGCAAIDRQTFFQIGMFDERKGGALNEDTAFGYEAISKGYKIFINTDIQVSHNHYYSLKGLIWNEFCKTVDWLQVLFTVKNKRVIQEYYLHQRNILSLLCIYLSLSCFLLVVFVSIKFAVLAISLLILFVFLNLPFYVLIKNEKGFKYSLAALFFHVVSFLTVGAGILAGVVTYRK